MMTAAIFLCLFALILLGLPIAVAMGLIREEDCIMIGDVPHAQIFGV